jgi:hypothetical protein
MRCLAPLRPKREESFFSVPPLPALRERGEEKRTSPAKPGEGGRRRGLSRLCGRGEKDEMEV